MSDLPTREAVGASLAVVDEASTMGVDPIVRYPTLRLILDAYRDGELVTIDHEAARLAAIEWLNAYVGNPPAVARAIIDAATGGTDD